MPAGRVPLLLGSALLAGSLLAAGLLLGKPRLERADERCRPLGLRGEVVSVRGEALSLAPAPSHRRKVGARAPVRIAVGRDTSIRRFAQPLELSELRRGDRIVAITRACQADGRLRLEARLIVVLSPAAGRPAPAAPTQGRRPPPVGGRGG
jgi:hypothetical protein